MNISSTQKNSYLILIAQPLALLMCQDSICCFLLLSFSSKIEKSSPNTRKIFDLVFKIPVISTLLHFKFQRTGHTNDSINQKTKMFESECEKAKVPRGPFYLKLFKSCICNIRLFAYLLMKQIGFNQLDIFKLYTKFQTSKLIISNLLVSITMAQVRLY